MGVLCLCLRCFLVELFFSSRLAGF